MEKIIVHFQVYGNQICATFKGFTDFQEDPVGYGDNPEMALGDLMRNDDAKRFSNLYIPLGVRGVAVTSDNKPMPKRRSASA